MLLTFLLLQERRELQLVEDIGGRKWLYWVVFIFMLYLHIYAVFQQLFFHELHAVILIFS